MILHYILNFSLTILLCVFPYFCYNIAINHITRTFIICLVAVQHDASPASPVFLVVVFELFSFGGTSQNTIMHVCDRID